MARYLFAIDYFDWDSYVATFAADGELEFASGTSKGRDAIRAAVTNFSSRIGQFYHTEDGKPAKLRHVILQSSIRVEGNTRVGAARCGSRWPTTAQGDTMKMGTYGMYEDDAQAGERPLAFAQSARAQRIPQGPQSGRPTRCATWTPRQPHARRAKRSRH